MLSIRNTLRKKDDELKEPEKEAYFKWSALWFHPKDIFKHPYTNENGDDSSSLSIMRTWTEEKRIDFVHEAYHTREEIVIKTYPRKAQQFSKKS